MKNIILFGLIFSLVALNCMAESPMKLYGSSGKEILENVTGITILNQTANGTIANSTWNQSANSTMKSTGGLWSWGMVPEGYSLNKSGKLDKIPSQEEWHPSI
jgi:fucose permease